MARGIQLGHYSRPSRKKRPGIHAKTKTSRCKQSKNYVKAHRGQGR